MLINKFLIDQGFIFVNNVDKDYLKTLSNLGSKPIFIYKYKNIRIASTINIYGIFYYNYFILDHLYHNKDCEGITFLNEISQHDLEICTIKDIKKILYNVKRYKMRDMLYYINILKC